MLQLAECFVGVAILHLAPLSTDEDVVVGVLESASSFPLYELWVRALCPV